MAGWPNRRGGAGGVLAESQAKPDEAVAAFRPAVLHKLTYMVGKDPRARARARLVRRDGARGRATTSSTAGSTPTRRTYRDGRKRVYYLSLEFLIGRLLFDALDQSRPHRDRARGAATSSASISTGLRKLEPDAALGNGGLGRLAACFMDSMATLGDPRARLRHPLRPRPLPPGASATAGSTRLPEDWLSSGNPWEFERPEVTYAIGFGGSGRDASRATTARTRYVWHPAETRERGRLRHADRRLARPARQHAAAVVGARDRPAAARRLQPRRPCRRARRRVRARGDLRVLYPSDATPAGQELRLRQEYFFASASLQDLMRRHMQQHGDARVARPSTSRSSSTTRIRRSRIAELMRLLVDVHEHAVGRGLDDHARRRSPTPTTRCCRRRSKPGRCR